MSATIAPGTLDQLARGRADPERVRAWCARPPWPLGANFLPSTAGNQLEMWQAATFDPGTIARELGWAAGLGLTSVRIYLHDLLWTHDRDGFLARLDRVLDLAAARGMSALIVLFDCCWHPVPRLGAQPEPEPRVHNSTWVQSPGRDALIDPARFRALRPYVEGILARHRDDARILGWDLWNEPGNPNAGAYGPRDLGEAKAEVVAPLLAEAFAWARASAPSQPLTSGIWTYSDPPGTWSACALIQAAASDVLSFHSYSDPTTIALQLSALGGLAQGRPLWCTEFMARPSCTLAAALPVIASACGGAWCWGLVDGRSQTKFPWDSWQRTLPPEPEPWHHDLLRRDGGPYRDDEAALLRAFAARTR
jgi:hypothetical protein